MRQGWRGVARRDAGGRLWLGRHGESGLGELWFGVARQASRGLARPGTIWHGQAGMDASPCGVRPGAAGEVRSGESRHGVAGLAGRCKSRLGRARHGRAGMAGKAMRGAAGRGVARHGRHGPPSRGGVRHGEVGGVWQATSTKERHYEFRVEGWLAVPGQGRDGGA